MVPEALRQELRRLAASSRTRVVPASRKEPCDWRPRTVRHPECGDYFTDAGAWEYVAALIAADIHIETVPLDVPKGKKGYVIKVPGYRGEPRIYIKLRIGAGAVIGRSFHYEYPLETR
jgi:hypothetical protein